MSKKDIKIKYVGEGKFEVNNILMIYVNGQVYNTGRLKASDFRECSRFINDYMKNNHHRKQYDIELIR